ncbi:MAG: type 1 glutamine amidotransferase [Euryarchaeota archaeon]|nr:type 1 glutamine amidotransferase [Euryarchaeota archaeon]
MKILALQHVACENMGGLEKALNEKSIEYEYLPLYEGVKVPRNFRGYNGLVILGGPMNVYEEDKYPFLRDENVLIKKALSDKIPTLGICLGAQLIAKACGARVTKGERKEIGWYDLKLTREGERDRIFRGFKQKFKVFQWHGDAFEIPRSAVRLATSDLFPNQAYRIANAYAFQFHLEVSEAMIYDWMEEYKDELASLEYIDAGKIREDTKKHVAELNALAEKFYANFMKVLGVR